MKYRRISTLKPLDEFAEYIAAPGLDLPCDREVQVGPDAPLAQPYRLGDRITGNRFCALPMEGWDGTLNSQPTELTIRRWENFGRSGAKLIWGRDSWRVTRRPGQPKHVDHQRRQPVTARVAKKENDCCTSSQVRSGGRPISRPPIRSRRTLLSSMPSDNTSCFFSYYSYSM